MFISTKLEKLNWKSVSQSELSPYKKAIIDKSEKNSSSLIIFESVVLGHVLAFIFLFEFHSVKTFDSLFSWPKLR